MTSTSPSKTSKILATPIENVEDSRAQRLQRQQSRFRDRGGIFVPTSRNRLADILLGKASPVKKPGSRRSVSASPSKGRGKQQQTQAKSLVPDTPVVEKDLRRSPRKKIRDVSVNDSDDTEKLTGYDAPKRRSHISKPVSKASSSRAGSKVPNGDDDAAEVTRSGKKTPPTKPTKRSVSSRTNKKTESKRRDGKSVQYDEDDKSVVEKNDKKASSSGRTKTTSQTKLEPSTTTTRSSTRQAARRKGKAGNVNKSDYSEADSDAPKGVVANSKNKKTSSKTSTSASASQTQPASRQPKKLSTSKPAVTRLPDIMEEEEEEEADDQYTHAPPKTKSNSKTVPEADKSNKNLSSAPLTGKKRTIEETDPFVDSPEPPQKRARPQASKESSDKQSKAKKPSVQTKKSGETTKRNQASSKKPRRRSRRTPEETTDEDEDPDEESRMMYAGKRKRDEEDQLPKTRPDVKRKKVETKTETEDGEALRTKATTSRRVPTKTAKRKENTTSSVINPKDPEIVKILPPAPQIQRPRGPPKSVLLLIQHSSSVLQVVDDEPDPIDFLSTPRRRRLL